MQKLTLSDAASLWMWTTAQLRSSGMSKHDIARAVASGGLVRARQGVYVRRDAHPDVLAAAAISARLTCVSLLSFHGVFVRVRPDGVHAHVPKTASRTPCPDGGALHWKPLRRPAPHEQCAVTVLDALLHASECLSDHDFVAAVDSALHLDLLRPTERDELFASIAPRKRLLRRHVDARAESGPESLVRLMARELGFQVDVQVRIAGVGRVDLLLDGWLVVECDSRAHHSSWEAQREDMRRDQELARLGYTRYRILAEDILFHPERVITALRGLRARGRSQAMRA